RRRRLARVVAQQGADPLVDVSPADRREAAHLPLATEPVPPRDPPGGPVADVGAPLDPLHAEGPEGGVEQEPDGAGHDAGAAGLGGRPVADLAAALRPAEADHPEESAGAAHRPGDVRPLLPAGGDELAEERLGVLAPVGRGHRRPALHLRVPADLGDAVDVVEAGGDEGEVAVVQEEGLHYAGDYEPRASQCQQIPTVAAPSNRHSSYSRASPTVCRW